MSHFPELRLNRRRLAGLAATAGAVPLLDLAAGSAATAQAPPPSAPGSQHTRYRLHRERDSVVSAADVPIATVPGLARSRGATRTPVLEATGFSMVGLTWRSGGGPVRARFRRATGGWTAWQRLEQLHDGPDPDEPTHGRLATELTWVGWCDAVQLEVPGRLQDPVLALIDPGRSTADTLDGPDLDDDEDDDDDDDGAVLGRLGRRRRRVPRPFIRSRGRWGAPEHRPRIQQRNMTIRQMHVHHTASSNSYRKRDVAGIIRGIHRYHTRNLGWSDIGYNFLVDKWGRIWVGRRGSVWYRTRGAHTLGFNHTSFGVAVIGNFQTARPNDKIIVGLQRLGAWQLWRHRRNPTARIRVRSYGSDRFADGEIARLPVIDGHRHTSTTACPGWYLFRELPRLRRLTKRRINRFIR